MSWTFSYVIFNGIQEVTRQRQLDIPAWNSPDIWQMPGPAKGPPGMSAPQLLLPQSPPTVTPQPWRGGACSWSSVPLVRTSTDMQDPRGQQTHSALTARQPVCQGGVLLWPPAPGAQAPATGAPCVQTANRAPPHVPRGRAEALSPATQAQAYLLGL